MKQILILLFLACVALVQAKTTSSVGPGLWTNAGTWNNGVPAAGDIVIVNHAVTYNTNYTVSGSGSLTVNSPGSLIDAPGGADFDLTLVNSGSLVVNGTLRIEGDFNMRNNSTLNVNGCDTLETGDSEIENNTTLTIATCGAWIVNGDLDLENNTGIDADGFIQVNGDVESRNNAQITGNGNLWASGEVDIRNSSSIFGSTTDCPTGPCFYGSGFPLALKLVYFGIGNVGNDFSELTWTVEDESEVMYYEIQQSTDGNYWTEYEHVKPLGLKENTSYTLSVPNTDAALYFRLLALELSGQVIRSHIVAIETNTNTSQIEISFYPNPARDRVYLKGVYSSFAIYSIHGDLVKQGSASTIDVSDLSKGLYTLQITGVNYERYSSSLIIQ